MSGIKMLPNWFTTIIGFSLMVCFFSCTNNATNAPATEVKDTTTSSSIAADIDSSDEHDDDEMEPLELNNGAKWEISKEMKPFLTESEKLCKDYITHHANDYKKLATQLETQKSALVDHCNMEGQAHDELHKWLVPYMALLDDLAEAESATEANNTIKKLEASFQTLHTYFQ